LFSSAHSSILVTMRPFYSPGGILRRWEVSLVPW